MAAAFDSKSVAANGAPRNTGYFQVAGISPDTGAVSVSGNFPAPTPAESASGAVSGLLKNPNATGTDAGITAIADGENLNVAPLASCVLPWGGKVAHNATVTAYQSATAAFGTSCVSEQRKCNDGALSGTFEVQNCSVTAAAACALPWGGTVPHGDVATAYSEASIPFAAAYGCADRKQDRECVDGTLSGSVSYDKEACVKGEASACAANASYSKNAHTYSVPLLAHGADSGNLTSADVSENHGVFRYSLTLSCNDGAYANENESGPAVASCDAGYAWDAGSSSCKAAVNGTCGTAAKSYANSASSYGSDAFCALGNGIAAPASPTFPGAGASVTWTCGGSFGGSASPTCTASRGSCATAPSFPNMGALTVGNPTSIGQAWTY
ncbi:MAG: hypothetical protein QG650_1102 [Patescibacteria group bacterium]|nr:hypothetical protein [Patescibacteria group bacterium]